MPREYLQRDLLIARKWAAKRFPGELVEFQAPLHDTRGIPEDVLKTFGVSLFMRSFPRADVLVVREHEVILAEIKSEPQPREIQNLFFYRDVLLNDVVRKDDIKGKKIRLIFVSGTTDVRIRALAADLGVEYEELV